MPQCEWTLYPLRMIRHIFGQLLRGFMRLKRQCQQIFNTFLSEHLSSAQYEQAQTVSQNFSFSQRNSRKVNDYADTMST